MWSSRAHRPRPLMTFSGCEVQVSCPSTDTRLTFSHDWTWASGLWPLLTHHTGGACCHCDFITAAGLGHRAVRSPPPTPAQLSTVLPGRTSLCTVPRTVGSHTPDLKGRVATQFMWNSAQGLVAFPRSIYAFDHLHLNVQTHGL